MENFTISDIVDYVLKAICIVAFIVLMYVGSRVNGTYFDFIGRIRNRSAYLAMSLFAPMIVIVVAIILLVTWYRGAGR